MNILSYLAGRCGDRYSGHDFPAYLMGKVAGSVVVVWKTVSGEIVHITDALARPAKSLIVKIEPVQEGSGDPSPTNVRSISGWEGTQLNVNGTVIPISWQSEAGTVYGGTLDVTSGVLTVDMAMVDLGTLTWTRLAAGDNYVFYTTDISKAYNFNFLCSQYANSHTVRNYMPDKTCGVTNTTMNVFCIRDDIYTEDDVFKSAMDGVQLCYELATPIEYNLTAQEVILFSGENNIWNDVGETEITYATQ